VTAVIQWEITGAEGSENDRWQLTIRDGACTCVRGGDAEPDVVYQVAPVDFIKLITGVASGPQMFVFGKLRIRGNLMLAARVQGFFTMPTAPG
jgi:putative sterol carrier protein